VNSKERTLMALAHQQPDRVPVDYLYNSGIDLRLKQHFGLAATDDEGLRQKLGVDFRYLPGAAYVGPRLFAEVPQRMINEWGIHRRWVEHESGGYWDYCDFLLKDATLETIAHWPFPSPDDYDYSMVLPMCERYSSYCLVAGGAGIPDIINASGMVWTMENVLLNIATQEPAFLEYLDRKLSVLYEIWARILEKGRGKIDVFYMGEDLGTQIGPMISLKLFRAFFRPRIQKFIDLAKSCGLPVMFHSCGSSSWAFEDFIEMGVNIMDTLQPEAKNMDAAYLKTKFGSRLAFHGCISTAGAVAFGTPQQTVAHARQVLETMMPGGGYAFSPSHQLQDNSPTENVLALYECAREFGRYR
jgi:uroporphyrinogen decarboxylase